MTAATASVGLDLGLSSGAVAVVWRQGDAYAVQCRAWDGPEAAADARSWLGLVRACLPVPLASRWSCESAHVDRRRTRAGEAQLRSAADWSHRAGEMGAVLHDVSPRTWRADYGLPQGAAAACREARALVRLLWPSLVLGSRDHVADACLLALRDAGGVGWAKRAQARAGADPAVPEWVAAQIAKVGRRGFPDGRG
jgi:hypothetical protein